MANTDIARDGRRTAWRNPVLRFEGSCRAPAEVVYDLLADLAESPGLGRPTAARDHPAAHASGAARTGRRRGRVPHYRLRRQGRPWSDRSVVTEATRPEVFEFVTEGRREGKAGSRPWLLTAVAPLRHRPGGGRLPA